MVGIDLSKKIALVTGASQGLGRQIAHTLHAAGAHVAVNYFADPAGANHDNAAQVVNELGDRAMIVAADVRRRDAVAHMCDTVVDNFGGLDIVVNNAGILRDRSVKKMSVAEWQDVIDTNLTGVFNVCQAAASCLRDGGRIVNLSSLAGVVGFFGQANYGAAKAGVISLTKVLSKELAKRQITVNAIAPGVVLTDMGKAIPAASREMMLSQIPLERFAEPEEIANVALFLASDLASYMTGQTLHVNGGWWG